MIFLFGWQLFLAFFLCKVQHCMALQIKKKIIFVALMNFNFQCQKQKNMLFKLVK